MRNNLFLLVILCSSRTCLLAEELLYVLLSFSVSMLVTLTGCCRLRRRHFQCLLVSLPAWLFLLSFAAFDCNFSRCTDVIEHQKGCFPPPPLSLFLFFNFQTSVTRSNCGTGIRSSFAFIHSSFLCLCV